MAQPLRPHRTGSASQVYRAVTSEDPVQVEHVIAHARMVGVTPRALLDGIADMIDRQAQNHCESESIALSEQAQAIRHSAATVENIIETGIRRQP